MPSDYEYNDSMLIAGPFVGEFGWELMKWQACVRHEAKKYNTAIVCSRSSMKYIYEDFAGFMPHDIKGMSSCYGIKPLTKHEAERLKGLNDKLDAMAEGKNICRYPGNLNPKKNYPSEFIKYYEESDESYDVVMHARSIGKAAMRNWPTDKWDELTNRLINSGIKVAAIGAPGQAYVPPGVDNHITWGIKKTVAVICSSKIVIGPSSGPMHLASLCGAKHLVWSHRVKKTAVKASNRDRYEKLWNPLDTECIVVDEHDWDPPVDHIYDIIMGLQ